MNVHSKFGAWHTCTWRISGGQGNLRVNVSYISLTTYIEVTCWVASLNTHSIVFYVEMWKIVPKSSSLLLVLCCAFVILHSIYAGQIQSGCIVWMCNHLPVPVKHTCIIMYKRKKNMHVCNNIINFKELYQPLENIFSRCTIEWSRGDSNLWRLLYQVTI